MTKLVIMYNFADESQNHFLLVNQQTYYYE